MLDCDLGSCFPGRALSPKPEPLRKELAKTMKAGIHPAYQEVNVLCACGSSFKTRSTHKGDIRVEICASCHPFFTGRQKLVDTEGRVSRFEKKYAKSREMAAQRKAAADTKQAAR
jgi:large subunit ribosomal protein L31